MLLAGHPDSHVQHVLQRDAIPCLQARQHRYVPGDRILRGQGPLVDGDGYSCGHQCLGHRVDEVPVIGPEATPVRLVPDLAAMEHQQGVGAE